MSRDIAAELCDYDTIIETCKELGDETLMAFVVNKKFLSLLLQYMSPLAHVAFLREVRKQLMTQVCVSCAALASKCILCNCSLLRSVIERSRCDSACKRQRPCKC
jgi:hypothetical protein